MIQWGLVPSWAKDPAIGNTIINARAETLAEKPAFKRLIGKRRCLVLADGFYEGRGGLSAVNSSAILFNTQGSWEWRFSLA